MKLYLDKWTKFPYFRLRGIAATLPMILITTISCSDGVSDETFAGMMVCAKVSALDRKIQLSGPNQDLTREIDEIYSAATNAIQMNQERYDQLMLLVSQFKNAVIQGDEYQLLALVAVEGECENLDMWVE